MRLFLIGLTCLFFISCAEKKEKTTSDIATEDTELKELFNLMQGSFNSEKQSFADTTYYNISLHMYPIWESEGHYLYVEQALNSMQNKPYRQRIYEVTRVNDSLFSSAVYEIENDSLWIGKWKEPNAFDSIPKQSVVLKKGCEVYLKRIGANHYTGSTKENSCPSSLFGASFAASTVTITKGKIESWDQGFDADGNQVWGAEKGGYIFNKLQ